MRLPWKQKDRALQQYHLARWLGLSHRESMEAAFRRGKTEKIPGFDLELIVVGGYPDVFAPIRLGVINGGCDSLAITLEDGRVVSLNMEVSKR